MALHGRRGDRDAGPAGDTVTLRLTATMLVTVSGRNR